MQKKNVFNFKLSIINKSIEIDLSTFKSTLSDSLLFTTDLHNCIYKYLCLFFIQACKQVDIRVGQKCIYINYIGST